MPHCWKSHALAQIHNNHTLLYVHVLSSITNIHSIIVMLLFYENTIYTVGGYTAIFLVLSTYIGANVHWNLIG